MEPMTSGMLYCSNTRYTFALLVRAGVVIDAPPVVRQHYLRRAVDDVVGSLRKRGYRMVWTPEPDTKGLAADGMLVVHNRRGSFTVPIRNGRVYGTLRSTWRWMYGYTLHDLLAELKARGNHVEWLPRAEEL